tara:strand:+ start:414 stop:815 length:402 start_codon:yes stop_codon:yes gene_type:complete
MNPKDILMKELQQLAEEDTTKTNENKMITIETIKIMMRSSTTIEEHKEIYEMLKEKKSEINRVMWETTETLAEKTSDVPMDIDKLKEYVESISDQERELLEELAKNQEKHAILLNQIDALMRETHQKIRRFYL